MSYDPMLMRPRFHLAFAFAAITGGAFLLPLTSEAAADEETKDVPAAKAPQQLGELLFAAIQSGDEGKAAALIPPQEVAEKAIAALRFPDEETKRKQTPLLKKHFADLKPKFAAMLKSTAEFAKVNKIDWKDARVVEVDAKTRVGREGVEQFSKMKVQIVLGSDAKASVTIEMDDGSKLGDAWYFTDAPLAIEVVRDGKTAREDLRKPANR
jgi:hypothetical protein